MSVWPAPLQAGDQVQLAAASSALQPDALERMEAGIAVLEGWGLQVDRHREPLRRWGHLAGSDPQRLADLNPSAPLVACLRGGWGSARLLELANEPAPHGMPHWLLGFSDLTSLLWARQAAGQTGGVHARHVGRRIHFLLFGARAVPRHDVGRVDGRGGVVGGV